MKEINYTLTDSNLHHILTKSKNNINNRSSTKIINNNHSNNHSINQINQSNKFNLNNLKRNSFFTKKPCEINISNNTKNITHVFTQENEKKINPIFSRKKYSLIKPTEYEFDKFYVLGLEDNIENSLEHSNHIYHKNNYDINKLKKVLNKNLAGLFKKVNNGKNYSRSIENPFIIKRLESPDVSSVEFSKFNLVKSGSIPISGILNIENNSANNSNEPNVKLKRMKSGIIDEYNNSSIRMGSMYEFNSPNNTYGNNSSDNNCNNSNINSSSNKFNFLPSILKDNKSVMMHAIQEQEENNNVNANNPNPNTNINNPNPNTNPSNLILSNSNSKISKYLNFLSGVQKQRSSTRKSTHTNPTSFITMDKVSSSVNTTSVVNTSITNDFTNNNSGNTNNFNYINTEDNSDYSQYLSLLKQRQKVEVSNFHCFKDHRDNKSKQISSIISFKS